jgi:hypothetical protein
MTETEQSTMHHMVTMPRHRRNDGLASPLKVALDKNQRVIGVLAEDDVWVKNDQLFAWMQQAVDLHYATMSSSEKDMTKEMEAFIDAARDPANPFHDGITWDDEAAAAKYLEQYLRETKSIPTA